MTVVAFGVFLAGGEWSDGHCDTTAVGVFVNWEDAIGHCLGLV